ncbi:MAG: response regulator, partial [Verrucomicrobia bacterium]|nr:response regulator [Verrucomicrobiota bacterium]
IGAEQQLRQLSVAVEQSPMSIVITDPQGAIEYVNPNFVELTGYTPAEVLGRNSRLLQSGQTPPETYRQMWAALSAGHVWRGEFCNKKKNGEFYSELAVISPVRDEAGQTTHFLAIKEDVTERKTLEARFLRAQRLESIGTLASGVAHDLNNILAPIQMATQLLREEHDEGERRRILDTIDASAQRGATIVKQVLTFARGVEGERVLLQPRHLVREILKIAQATFPKNIMFASQNPKDLWAVTGDATQLHQVLLNLCLNARDAMPNGGTLSVRAENLAADASFVAMTPEARIGQYVVLQVADTGIGIPATVLDRIFDPFFTTKPVGRGTGLGLSTVLGIVKSHGGFLTVSSQVDHGTTFKVFLPATSTRPPPTAGTITALGRRGQGELVLVADDEPAIRDVTVRMLEQSGYTSLSAADGTEALALYSQHRTAVKVVVTDILMPEMDGPALARILRRMAPDLPIIASTGLGQSDKVEELRELGVKWFLAKPYTAAKLLETLQKVLPTPAG